MLFVFQGSSPEDFLSHYSSLSLIVGIIFIFFCALSLVICLSLNSVNYGIYQAESTRVGDASILEKRREYTVTSIVSAFLFNCFGVAIYMPTLVSTFYWEKVEFTKSEMITTYRIMSAVIALLSIISWGVISCFSKSTEGSGASIGGARMGDQEVEMAKDRCLV